MAHIQKINGHVYFKQKNKLTSMTLMPDINIYVVELQKLEERPSLCEVAIHRGQKNIAQQKCVG